MRDSNVDGVVVGRPYQEIYEQSATQKYPIGTIHERHGRRWRYCKAYETFLFNHRLAPNMALQGGDTGGTAFGIEKNLYTGAAGIAGDTSVLVETTVAYAVDYFFGGLMVLFTGANPALYCLRVSGNDLGTGAYVKIYLDEPLPIDVPVTYGVNIHPSPYMNVGSSEHCANAPIVCVPMVIASSGYFFWGQTRGPCWVTPNTFAWGPEKVALTDGTIVKATSSEVRQCVGIAGCRSSNGSYDDGVIMLHLE